MKKRFTEEQIIRIFKQAESGEKVKELCREHGIAQGTFYPHPRIEGKRFTGWVRFG